MAPERIPTITAWPRVTIQLPVFNERDVIDRLIAAIEGLDYPANCLQVQILDDSTDDTVERSLAGARRLCARGISTEVLRRENRVGFKAGALAQGLTRADSPYIAIFDADFIPTADFLRRTIPWLEQGYGMVQARWGHLNLDDSWLTRAQGVLLDGHFVIEHTARYKSGRWFNFNGTAGVWRREALVMAGGWASDTLTEDLDISYRAQLAGWRFKYLPDLVQPAELPPTVTAFKSQQHRWAKGSIQTARKLLRPIWQSPSPVGRKIEATLHLIANFGHPLLLTVLLLLPWVVTLQETGIRPWLEAFPLMGFPFLPVILLSFFVFYLVAVQAPPYGSVGRRLLHIPLALVLAIGIAPSQTRAVYEGLLKNPGVFQRTPKQGAAKSPSYRAAATFPFMEFFMGAYVLASWLFLVVKGHYLGLWFSAICAFGFLFVGFQQIAESRPYKSEKP